MKRLLAFSRSHWLLFLLMGMAAGAAVGFIVFRIAQLTSAQLYLIAGGLIGFVVAAAYVIARGRVQVTEFTVSFPQLGSVKFSVDAEDRQVAWQLFIETATRIATQPLRAEEGFLREALNSLYSLFATTRELLRGMRPSNVTEGETVETAAVAMLNKDLRPFLSKWHPALTAFESLEPKKAEHEWERNEEFRRELEQLRQRLLSYAQGFGELAEVSRLDQLLSDEELP
jgi:hypothetical protein